jgi:putative redox protein
MFASLSWKGKLSFEAMTGSGHRFGLDTKPQAGGESKGPTPMEVLLVSLAGCTGMDVASILKKKKVNVQHMTVRADGQQAPEHPKYFTHIEVVFDIEGKDIREEDVKRAIELSKEKYCSVSVMLEPKAEISYRWNIVNKD